MIQKLARANANKLDAERARDALKANATASTMASTSGTIQAQKRPRTEDLPPEQQTIYDLFQQLVEHHIFPVQHQIKSIETTQQSILSNIRDQINVYTPTRPETQLTQPTHNPVQRSQPRRLRMTIAAASTQSSTPTETSTSSLQPPKKT